MVEERTSDVLWGQWEGRGGGAGSESGPSHLHLLRRSLSTSPLHPLPSWLQLLRLTPEACLAAWCCFHPHFSPPPHKRSQLTFQPLAFSVLLEKIQIQKRKKSGCGLKLEHFLQSSANLSAGLNFLSCAHPTPRNTHTRINVRARIRSREGCRIEGREKRRNEGESGRGGIEKADTGLDN